MGSFKKGDRVRLTCDNMGFGKTGDAGEIVNPDAGCEDALVRFDREICGDREWFVSWSSLEPVAVAKQPQPPAKEPLRIQPGKFYLTRDGRKVGPMRRWSGETEHPWEADDDDLPYIWADDGTEIDSDIDDGADLVAEASSSDNGSTGYGSTAGFTVPLCAYEDEPGWYAAELGRAYADGYAAGLRASQEQAA